MAGLMTYHLSQNSSEKFYFKLENFFSWHIPPFAVVEEEGFLKLLIHVWYPIINSVSGYEAKNILLLVGNIDLL